MGEQVAKVPLAPCVADLFPYNETLIKKIKAKPGVEVVIGTHPDIPENILAS